MYTYRLLPLITLLLLQLLFLVQFNTALPVQKEVDLNSHIIDDLDTFYRWPSIISTPLVKLLGDTCYETLFEEFHITDVPCLKLAISKGLGLGIVVGGAIVKIPQIITIVKHQSAKGLSLTSFLLETCAYEIVLVYNTRLYHPFSTYGEVLFMTLQNICIALLIVYYNKNDSKMKMLYLMGGFWGGFLFLQMIPSWLMSILYAAQIPIGLASKVPQIRANYVNQSTGQLSVFAVLNYFIGTAARSFTTYAELDDPIMLGGNLLATVLNGILVVQLIIYYEKPVSGTVDREGLYTSSNKAE
jgi:mannose-P-dolichol utilization defect protein 1